MPNDLLFINNCLFKQNVCPHLNSLFGPCVLCVRFRLATDTTTEPHFTITAQRARAKLLLRTLASFSVPGQRQQHRNVNLDHRRGRTESDFHLTFSLSSSASL